MPSTTPADQLQRLRAALAVGRAEADDRGDRGERRPPVRQQQHAPRTRRWSRPAAVCRIGHMRVRAGDSGRAGLANKHGWQTRSRTRRGPARAPTPGRSSQRRAGYQPPPRSGVGVAAGLLPAAAAGRSRSSSGRSPSLTVSVFLAPLRVTLTCDLVAGACARRRATESARRVVDGLAAERGDHVAGAAGRRRRPGRRPVTAPTWAPAPGASWVWTPR